jgi:hypothetical protein
LAIVLYGWSLFVYFVLFFLWSLCCIADHCLSVLSLFSFGHCAVLLITVCLFYPLSSCTVCCFFDLRFLINPLVSSNRSMHTIIAHNFFWTLLTKYNIQTQHMNSATWSLILDITSNLTFNNQYLIKKVKIQQVFVFFLNAFSIILIYNPLVLSTFRPFPHS